VTHRTAHFGADYLAIGPVAIGDLKFLEEPNMFTSCDGPVEEAGGGRELQDAKQPQEAKPDATSAPGGDEAERLVFTLRAATGQILKVEKVGAAGKCGEIPMDEAAALAGIDNMNGVESALDDAFEAGIVSMLDPQSDAEESEQRDQTAEEMRLRRELLTLIIGSKVRHRLLDRLAGRVILSRTMESKG
jgi:hypothetical protein